VQVVESLGFWIPVYRVIVRVEWVLGIEGGDDVGGTECGLGVEVDRLVVSLQEDLYVGMEVDVH